MKISPKQYAHLLISSLRSGDKWHSREKATAIIKSLAKIICERGDTSKIGEINSAIVKTWNEVSGEIDVVVKVSDEKEHVKIPEKIQGKKTNVLRVVDRSVIAGTEITIGDMVIDNTLRKRMETLDRVFS